MIIKQYVQIIPIFFSKKDSNIHKIWLESSILHYTELDLSNIQSYFLLWEKIDSYVQWHFSLHVNVLFCI